MPHDTLLENGSIFVGIKVRGSTISYIWKIKHLPKILENSNKSNGHAVFVNGVQKYWRDASGLEVGISNNGWFYVKYKDTQIPAGSMQVPGIDFVGLPLGSNVQII